MTDQARIDLAIRLWGRKLGTRIGSSTRTTAHMYDVDVTRGYTVCLIGPLYDLGNPDVRLWVNDRTLDGRRTLSLRVQDQDDDVILNVDAVGIEKYNLGDIWLNPQEEN